MPSGSYTVSLTVVDSAGVRGVASRVVSVQASLPPPPGGLVLTATGTRARGGRHVGHLVWSGATSAPVDIHRNGTRVTTTANSDSYNDAAGTVGRATYVYAVCEAGTTVCSNETTVVFS